MVIGMIGGMGPESTVDYYKQIVRRCHERLPDSRLPPDNNEQHRHGACAQTGGGTALG